MHYQILCAYTYSALSIFFHHAIIVIISCAVFVALACFNMTVHLIFDELTADTTAYSNTSFS